MSSMQVDFQAVLSTHAVTLITLNIGTPVKRILYFDCVGGAGGDMILAALISLGAPLSDIEKGLESLKLSGCAIGNPS